MIDKKTVLILGAGASMPYGYPSGFALRTKIYTEFYSQYMKYLEAQADYIQRQMDMDYYIKTVKQEDPKDFVEKFRDSNISIDLFLSLNKKHEIIGKKAIALSILRYEGASQFKDNLIPEKENWYKFLLNRLVGKLTKKDDYKNISNNNISIITFNYDRSLEYFLYKSLSSMFGEVDNTEIINELRKIKIIHLYGQVAKLKWQDNEIYLDYFYNRSEKDIFKTINLDYIFREIKVIYEERETNELKDAQRIIKEAKRIYFLGFGYAEENLETLDFSNMHNDTQKIYGTAFGMHENEMLGVKRRLLPAGKRIDKLYPGNMLIENTDCLTLLRKYF